MLVEFSPEVFKGIDQLSPIVAVLACVIKGRHDWSPDPLTLEAAKPYFKKHTPTMCSIYLELGRKGSVSAAWRPPLNTKSVHVKLDYLADVAEDLCRSAVLVVEDLRSDGCFIRAIAEVFRADRLLNALSHDWLEIWHGGGEQLPVVAMAARHSFRREVRVVTFLDSDRWLPGQFTKAHDKAGNLQKSGILVHVLELREAENYVPNHILAASNARHRRDVARKMGHMKRLNPAQRGHYDMKTGFRQKNGTVAVRKEQKELFDNLDEGTLRALGEGFGSDLLSKLEERCGKLTVSDFSKLGPGIEDELRELLSMISMVI